MSSAQATVRIPPKLVEVFDGEARFRGAYGGRGSAKTRTFAKMTAVRGYQFGRSGVSGQILCGREHLNSLDESSLEEVKAAIRSEPWLEAYYEIGEKYVKSRDGRISYAFAGLSQNVNSIKSKSRLLIVWVDEAENVRDSSWDKLIPTAREEGTLGDMAWNSEIWVTWNPERKDSATHKRFRMITPDKAKIVQMNWQDNPWFPDVLNRDRIDCLEKTPDKYAHIWEGDFVTAVEGAYYAKELAQARADGRIGRVARDPLLEVRAYWDIGGTGAKADATAIWLVQFSGQEIRWLDHYEASGQPLSVHVDWLRSRGYPVRTCVLPHDGGTHDRVYAVSYESALTAAGFEVVIIPNQGKGAAKARIEALRRLFPRCWFHEAATEAGRDALGWYHEKRDEKRNLGLGPNHDWSSHSADAAGLVAIAYADHGHAIDASQFDIPKGGHWLA